MAYVEGETIIDRPPEVVFDFVADERNERKYNPHVIWAELISGGAIGLGSQFRAARKSIGRALEMTIEWTEYERASRLGSTTRMQSADIHGVLTFAPRAEGIRMRWSLHPARSRRIHNAIGIGGYGRRDGCGTSPQSVIWMLQNRDRSMAASG